jgi:hypothetical protein
VKAHPSALGPKNGISSFWQKEASLFIGDWQLKLLHHREHVFP